MHNVWLPGLNLTFYFYGIDEQTQAAEALEVQGIRVCRQTVKIAA